MALSDPLLIVAISLFTAFLGEGVTWMLVYRTEKYQKLKVEIEKQTKKCKWIKFTRIAANRILQLQWRSERRCSASLSTSSRRRRSSGMRSDWRTTTVTCHLWKWNPCKSIRCAMKTFSDHSAIFQVLHRFRFHGTALDVQLDLWWKSRRPPALHSDLVDSRFVTSQPARHRLHRMLLHLSLHLVHHVDQAERAEDPRILTIKSCEQAGNFRCPTRPV